MNADTIKSELQQVLDNDIALRTEFNALKRSLSDYRNQLIMRDEDCKRLQVTIDVLNTKLLVLERDNTGYKAELTSFRELRGSINEQLQQKQDEIDARLAEIQELRGQLNEITTAYEDKLDQIRYSAENTVNTLKQEYEDRIAEIKSSSQYRESGMREEFENRLSEFTTAIANREHELEINHQEAIQALKDQHLQETEALKQQHQATLSTISSSGHEEVAGIKLEHQISLAQLEEKHQNQLAAMEESYTGEIERLKEALEDQRSTLTRNFNSQVEALKSEHEQSETALRDSLQSEIDVLKAGTSLSVEQVSAEFRDQLLAMESSHQASMQQTIADYEQRISTLVAEYEEKLSNTLIHSNSQNSRLNEELGRLESEQSNAANRIQELQEQLGQRGEEYDRVSGELERTGELLKAETERLLGLQNELEQFRQHSALSQSEQVNTLAGQLEYLNVQHASEVERLNAQLETQAEELANMGLLLQETTNNLSETEGRLEVAANEKALVVAQVAELNDRLSSFESSFSDTQEELENRSAELERDFTAKLKAKDLEFEKLLAENTNLINEIEDAQCRIEVLDSEITLLKGELDEVRMQSAGKSEYFKETLSHKNFEITNLEANLAALTKELEITKNQNTELREQKARHEELARAVEHLTKRTEDLTNEKHELLAQLDVMQTVISGLNEETASLNERIAGYEAQVQSIQNAGRSDEDELFISRLFKQIDELNDQRLQLLDEKEQMAGQLLRMNEVVGSISQQVDSESINVSALNNHRRNIILATNSEGEKNKPQMKEQINDLVREIDKCIALLSA